MLLVVYITAPEAVSNMSCHLRFVDLDVRDLVVEIVSKSFIREVGGAPLPVPPTKGAITLGIRLQERSLSLQGSQKIFLHSSMNQI